MVINHLLYKWDDPPSIPSLKLTANAPENGCLEDEFPFGVRPTFKGYVSFREGISSTSSLEAGNARFLPFQSNLQF